MCKVLRGLKVNDAFWELLAVHGRSQQDMKETMGRDVGKIVLRQVLTNLAGQAVQLSGLLSRCT